MEHACPLVVVVAELVDRFTHESVEVLCVMQSRYIGLHLLPSSLGLRGFRTAIPLHSIGFLFRIMHGDRIILTLLPALMTMI